MTSTTRSAARGAANTPAIHLLVRGGFAASGVVHAGIGLLAIVLARGGHGQADQSGALRAIAAVPAGFVLLWLIAVTLWALGVWYILEGFLVQAPDDTKEWVHRLESWGKALAYIAVGIIAATVASGGHPNSEKSSSRAGDAILRLPGGPFLLGLVGLLIAAIGVGFVVSGITRRFDKRVTLPAGAVDRTVTTLGVVGYIAKGLALVAFGVLLLVAAVKVDPAQAGGLDKALASLRQLPFGSWLLGAIGLGLIAYSLFLFARARYARL
ncbi:hypothetical protein LK09_16420 [Microbacterium mangrovi]|uniref:DUF1206 domain-containing protein n=1 Tax=Microbacterium mangrovi TaxID=1348253 RepID=A0A0B2A370_9MICO|nr:DUF1206 domain-containing protein [Microbacterium mangrovi]KHK96214.1 hypothetical protein LK09_16420 [Microbacterium mangrovi]